MKGEKISDIIKELTNSEVMKDFERTMQRYKNGGYKNKISELNLKYTNVPTTYPELTQHKLVDYLKSTGRYDTLNDKKDGKEKIVNEVKKDIATVTNTYNEEMNNADNDKTKDMDEMYEDISQRCLELGYQIPPVYIEALAKNSKYAFDSFCDLLERAERYKENGDEDMTDYCMERAYDILMANIT